VLTCGWSGKSGDDLANSTNCSLSAITIIPSMLECIRWRDFGDKCCELQRERSGSSRGVDPMGTEEVKRNYLRRADDRAQARMRRPGRPPASVRTVYG
jgi:hypothetical protein